MGDKRKAKPPAVQPPRSVGVASRGIRTSSDFAQLMSALMSDLIEGRVPPNVGNATCNAGGKLLKVVELEQKYGVQGDGQTKVLKLASALPPELADCDGKDATTH